MMIYFWNVVLHLWCVKDKVDVLHELLEVEDVVERPAHGGAGERVFHRVERAVQDDPVHLEILLTIMIVVVAVTLTL